MKLPTALTVAARQSAGAAALAAATRSTLLETLADGDLLGKSPKLGSETPKAISENVKSGGSD